MKLVIFDMDQTLVDLISVHDEATAELFRERFNINARLTEIDFAGRDLLDNFSELANLKGLPVNAIRVQGQQIVEDYERIFSEKMPQNASEYILPGVIELLEELGKTPHVIALYTGDSPGIVKTVLGSTCLDKYFRFYVCGTDAENRVGMARLAVDKAQRLSGKEFKGKDVVIIGDSTRDIECARELGAAAIAVATGFHTIEELLKQNPDYLFHSLGDTGGVLKAIG